MSNTKSGFNSIPLNLLRILACLGAAAMLITGIVSTSTTVLWTVAGITIILEIALTIISETARHKEDIQTLGVQQTRIKWAKERFHTWVELGTYCAFFGLAFLVTNAIITFRAPDTGTSQELFLAAGICFLLTGLALIMGSINRRHLKKAKQEKQEHSSFAVAGTENQFSVKH